MVITIEGQTFDELREKIFSIARSLGIETVSTPPVPVVEETPAIAPEPPPVIEPPKKTGRPRKEAAKIEQVTPVVPSVNAEPVELPEIGHGDAPAATVDEALAALQALNEKHGMPAARQALAKFGAVRLSGIKDEDLGAFVKVCSEMTAGA